MIKARLTFVDNSKGQKELEEVIKTIEKNYETLNKSRIYKGRHENMYSNIYLDIENKGEENLDGK